MTTDRARSRLLVLAVVVAVAGCNAMTWHYPDPPSVTHTPEIVGVLASETVIANGTRWTLTDGRTVDSVEQAGFERLGASAEGGLVLAGPNWTDMLPPMPGRPECWEAWPDLIAWDLGDAVEFGRDGLILRKAAGFTADPASRSINWRLAWTADDAGRPAHACVNKQGEVVWIKVEHV